MISGGLTGAIERIGWAALLPAHRADGDDQPAGKPNCVEAQWLAEGLLVAVVEDERGRTYGVPLVHTGSAVRRARPGDRVSEALVHLLAGGDRTLGRLELTTWHHETASGERAITVDQTNESVIVGDRAVVKWTFVADAGPHPAPSLLAELERNGFTGMPRPWAAVQWRPSDRSAPRLLALVTDFVPGAVDGWTWVVDDLRRAARSGDARIAREAGGAVGALVASFHRALAGTARKSTGGESAAWRTGALADLDLALQVSGGRAHELLTRHDREIRAAFDQLPDDPKPVMRVHGDLHVGQVLRSETGGSAAYVLTDFDGNPVVPSAERITEQPAALDVAGMAQSFIHAGLVVRQHNPSLDGGAVDRAAATGRAGFLGAYREGLGDRRDVLDDRLLRPFALRQVCREFIYAATHLPRWSYVPEVALPLLLRRDNV